MHKLKSVLGLGVLVLAGCGGDGGGWDLSMSPPVAITEENAVDVAVAAYYSMNYALGISNIGFSIGGGFIPLSTNAGAEKSFNLADFAEQQVRRVLGNGGKADTYRPAAIEKERETCTYGGTVTVTLNDADNDVEPSTGDTASISFDNCKEDEGTYDGTISMTLVDWPEDFDDLPYRLEVSFEANKLKLISVVGPMMRMNGKFSYLDETEDGDEFKTTVDIGSLAYSYTVEDESWSIAFKDYIASYAFNHATSEYSVAADGEVDDSDLGGSIRIETKDPFVGSFMDMVDWIDRDHPTSGELWLHGANGSKVQVTAQDDGERLLVNYDEDGDGEWDNEEGIELYWDELRPF